MGTPAVTPRPARPAPATAASPPSPLLTWSRQPQDDHRWVTGLAALGVTAAVAMAVFGLPPIDLHGLTHHLGAMDPFCGGTRSVRLAARGDWAGSWRHNPIGIPVLIGGVAVLARGIIGTLTGRWPTAEIHLIRRYPRLTGAIAALLLTALEINQQAHAALLIAHR